MFLFTPDMAQGRRLPLLECAKQGGRSLVTTVRKLRHYRNALTYLTYSDKIIEGSPDNAITAVAVLDQKIPLK